MATNNILGFCTGANPNVTPIANWQAKPSRTSGFVSGIAISSDINASIAGGANIAHAVGEFIKNQLNEDVNPTDETKLVSQFLRALQVFIQRGGACPVGSILPYLGGDIPYGWLLANGASVLRSQYDKLFALVGTKFGAVDEAHFNLPNLHHRFIEGTTSLSEVGNLVDAGLPNNYGTGVGLATNNNGQFIYSSWSGALTPKNNAWSGYERQPDQTNRDFGTEFELNFSKGNAIYSDSVTTVQVSALFGQYLIRYC